jgi:ubiquinone/menaquinone biosynthesis C-methylase UbiE
MVDNTAPATLRSYSDSSPPKYANAEYWDHRYTDCTDPFEWYESWAEIRPSIATLLTGKKNALNIGCGSSPMSTDALTDFERIVNIDISPVVIQQMTAKFASLSNIEWRVMNCMALAFEDNSFDAVLDKGTLDALFCGSVAMVHVAKTLAEVHRVLRPGGCCIDITYGRPGSRVPVFQETGLSWRLLEPVQIHSATRASSHWVYIFQKGCDGERITAE